MAETPEQRASRKAATMKRLKAKMDAAIDEFGDAAQTWAGPSSAHLRVELYPDHLRVRIDGKYHEVTEKQLDMLKVLHAAVGEWVGGKNICDRPDRVRKSMQTVVSSIIDTHKTKGYRIRPEMFELEN